MKWQTLVKAHLQVTQDHLDTFGTSGLAVVASDEVWMNDQYQVNVRRHIQPQGLGVMVTHLSIKRLDKGSAHNWRHFQYIKNQLVGPEYEAVEIYPPEQYMVDTANQYHLWVFENPQMLLPFGFFERLVSEDQFPQTKQEPWEENMRPNDLADMSQIIAEFKNRMKGE